MPTDKHTGKYAVHFFYTRPEGQRVLAEYLEAYLCERGWLDLAAKDKTD